MALIDLFNQFPGKFGTLPFRDQNSFFEGVFYNFTPQANTTGNYKFSYQGLLGKIYDIDSGSFSNSVGIAAGQFDLGEFDTFPVHGGPRVYGGTLSFHATYGSQTLDDVWSVVD